MESQRDTASQGLGNHSGHPWRILVSETFRYWEFRRLFYNSALLAVVIVWLAATWPHFRPMFSLNSLLLLIVLGLIANIFYCAAYLVDIPLQLSSVGGAWKNLRWLLWLIGTFLAIVLANYWIVDEIYPFVR